MVLWEYAGGSYWGTLSFEHFCLAEWHWRHLVNMLTSQCGGTTAHYSPSMATSDMWCCPQAQKLAYQNTRQLCIHSWFKKCANLRAHLLKVDHTFHVIYASRKSSFCTFSYGQLIVTDQWISVCRPVRMQGPWPSAFCLDSSRCLTGSIHL